MPLQNLGCIAYDDTPRASNLYRSAQPDLESFDMIRSALNVKTIIKLSHDDEIMTLSQEQEAFDSSRAMKVLGCAMPKLFRENETQHVISIVRQAHAFLEHGSVLVHCKFGTDRTGMVAAVHRMIYCKESLADAMENRAVFGVNVFRNCIDFEDHPVFAEVAKMIQDGTLKGDNVDGQASTPQQG